MFDGKPMIKHIKGAKNILGRCLVEKIPQSTQISEKEVFTIIAEQGAYVLGSFLLNFKSNLALVTAPVYLQNMHIYHIHEDYSYVGKM